MRRTIAEIQFPKLTCQSWELPLTYIESIRMWWALDMSQLLNSKDQETIKFRTIPSQPEQQHNQPKVKSKPLRHLTLAPSHQSKLRLSCLLNYQKAYCFINFPESTVKAKHTGLQQSERFFARIRKSTNSTGSLIFWKPEEILIEDINHRSTLWQMLTLKPMHLSKA